MAERIAFEHGLRCTSPVILRATNHTVALLEPHPVVAKIGSDRERLVRELAIAEWLSRRGAPVVAPSPLLPARVHSQAAIHVSYWTYVPPSRAEAVDDATLADALDTLQRDLRGLPPSVAGAMPGLERIIESVPTLLCDPMALGGLDDRDRDLLARAFERSRDDLRSEPADHIVLHGSPHRFNILELDGSPRFIDLETVCSGPREWDLAHLEPGVAAASPVNVNRRLLAICRALVSVATATWCWIDIDDGDLREHAEHHLAVVRQDMRE